MLKATVSGSFHRHLTAITAAVQELATLSIRVLSPADPRIVAAQGEFLYVASDRVRSVLLVENRHRQCIEASDFMWLVCPDGYVGASSSLEIGVAITAGVPIFATRAPADLTLREYVTVVPTLAEAARRVASRPRPNRPEGFLIDPHASAEEVHCILERIEDALTQQSDLASDPAPRVYRDLARLQTKLGLAAYMQ
jgi:hypothetical protein